MKNSTKEKRVADFMGQSYVCIPRKVLSMLFEGNSREKKIGFVYLSLLAKAYFIDGYVVLNKHPYSCRRGEYVGTCKHLSLCTGMSQASVCRMLKWLVKEGFVEMSPLEDGSRIRVNEYDLLTVSRITGKAEDTTDPSLFSRFAEAERLLGGRSMERDLAALEAERGEA